MLLSELIRSKSWAEQPKASTIQAKPDSTTPPNLYFYAMEQGKKESAQALANVGVKTEGYEEWKKSKPVVKQVYLYGIL